MWLDYKSMLQLWKKDIESYEYMRITLQDNYKKEGEIRETHSCM